VERSDNVINERSLWTFIERPRERCVNVGWWRSHDVHR